MKYTLFLTVFAIAINISCRKKNVSIGLTKSTTDTIYEKSKTLYFDDDIMKDEVKIVAQPDHEILNYVLSIHLSASNNTIKVPILNNSILYNNDYAVYYLSDPIIKNKTVEVRIDYANQKTVINNSGEKKNLIEKIKYRFNSKNRKIQIIGYDLSYSKSKKSNYVKSFNFITSEYYASQYLDGKKQDMHGTSVELQNIYVENWTPNFLNRLLFYGNEVE